MVAACDRPIATEASYRVASVWIPCSGGGVFAFARGSLARRMRLLPNMVTQETIIGSCPLCGDDDSPTYISYPQMTWARCHCQLIYKRSAARAAENSDIYGDPAYFQAGDAQHAHSYNRRTRHRVAKARRQIRDALNHTLPGPVLDVGCSLGYTLLGARSLGLPSAGIDVAPFAVDYCRDRGLSAEIGSLERMPFADGSFAIVTMKHVLEHTPDPRSALGEARRVLRPGGALFVAIPHAGYHKAARHPERSPFYRPDSPGGIEHFVYYTPSTLSRLIDDCGFRVVRVHPHLVHAKASAAVRLGQRMAAPFRFFADRVSDWLGLRKEFTLVALREGS